MAEFSEHTGEVKINDSPDELVTYANISGITVTQEEMILNFALREVGNPSEARSIVKVYVGIAHAKRIAIVMAQLLTEYEETFGVIEAQPKRRLTEESKKRLEQAVKSNVRDSK